MSNTSHISSLMLEEDYILFKCLLLGDSAVGKSSVVERYSV